MTTKCPKCHLDNPDTQRFCGDCGTQLPPLEEFSPSLTKTLETPQEELTRGTLFAQRYEIIEELGKGGMGKVYRVEDTKIKEEVALKLIKSEIASDKKTLERFSNELKLARKIAQRNVCKMHDLGEEKGIHYITMEYVSGGDLKKLIRRTKQLTAGTAISIAKQICEGLAEAHSLGIVHRDLKPSNIMIDDNGNARIMDFGIARPIKGKGITGAGVMIGTPEYMSPEQAEAKEIDQRSDIYSLGVILYEMVTGRVPFEGDTPLSVAMKQKGEIAQDPRELNPEIPEDLSHVILRCLEKDKAKRYQSTGEMRAELERLEQGLPTTDRIESKKKSLTSREITVQFKIRKLLIPIFLIIAIAAIGLIIWSPWTQRESTPIPESKPSIAVLPFEDLSPQQDQAHLCYGFSESIINALSQIKDLRIPAPNSSFSFMGNEPLKEIGEKLEVNNILRGSVQKAGDQVRITAQLINVEDESILWSQPYDRKVDDLFAIQDEISLEIVDKLKVNILGGEKESLIKRYTVNPEAYNLFLKGIYFWNKRTIDDIRKAIDNFEQAVELDPSYALAYARLADSYGLLPFYSPTLPKEAFTKARSAVMKALDIDETLAEAHSALGFIKMYYDWEWDAAEKEFRRAIQTNPSYVTAYHWYAEYLTWIGRHKEAIEHIELALKLDPLSRLINGIKAYVLVFAREYDRAIEQCQLALELNPDSTLPFSNLGKAYIGKHMYEEAIAVFQKRENKPRLGYAYALAGKRDEAQKILEELKEQWEQGAMTASSISKVYASLGEEELAIEWLEKSFERREPHMVMINVNPRYDSLRSHPRFIALLKKMNFK